MDFLEKNIHSAKVGRSLGGAANEERIPEEENQVINPLIVFFLILEVEN